MALFPDLGSWLPVFRSVKRDNFVESPILAIERLTTQAQPIGDSDKDTLVGAMLTLSSSLNQALSLVVEILPEDKSGERLGEILCPTLGQLLLALQNTLSSFEPREEEDHPRRYPPQVRSLHRLKHSRSESALRSSARPLTPIPIKRKSPPQTPLAQPQTASRFSSSPVKHSPLDSTFNREQFPVFQSLPEEYTQPRRESIASTGTRSSVRELAVEIQSELRVQAAIQVAVESLEFAEGQLQMVKAINRLHGGNFEKLQRHFYNGYNALLIKALQLGQRELSMSDDSEAEQQQPQKALPAPQTQPRPVTGHRQQPSIHVSFPANMPTPSSSPRSQQVMPGPHQPLTRRNTIQGIQEDDAPRPALKRRMSLAEELAMAGDSDEEDYDEEYDDSGDDDDKRSEPESAKSSGVSDFDPPGPKVSTAARLLVDLLSEADSLGESQEEEDDSDDSQEDEDEFDEEEGGNLSSNSSTGVVMNGDNVKSMMMPRLQETLL
ncbi:hypothetical protein QBC38DRAFT_481571 [Podospora fimiseda]|uniref:Uncharacterized protein n=1 Tax=Podospora fimiseda TaxID=252190 RepID=A0AAN7BMC7_9PEZI|nr:hypothetical protein QBC38DRAFT_481571 [Podospora fimiseda]